MTYHALQKCSDKKKNCFPKKNSQLLRTPSSSIPAYFLGVLEPISTEYNHIWAESAQAEPMTMLLMPSMCSAVPWGVARVDPETFWTSISLCSLVSGWLSISIKNVLQLFQRCQWCRQIHLVEKIYSLRVSISISAYTYIIRTSLLIWCWPTTRPWRVHHLPWTSTRATQARARRDALSYFAKQPGILGVNCGRNRSSSGTVSPHRGRA